MRGALFLIRNIMCVEGITPAYAGSTAILGLPSHRSRDHPRVCGEHFFWTKKRSQRPGSPPRMRGARRHGEQQERMVGITPAYAGSTANRFSMPHTWRDHPRVCGEHVKGLRNMYRDLGSPPRMRGAHDVRSLTSPSPGITPAYAGSTKRQRDSAV